MTSHIVNIILIKIKKNLVVIQDYYLKKLNCQLK